MKVKVNDRKATLLYYLVNNDPKFVVRLDNWRIERGLPRRFLIEMLVYLRNTTVAEGKELIQQFIKEKIFVPRQPPTKKPSP